MCIVNFREEMFKVKSRASTPALPVLSSPAVGVGAGLRSEGAWRRKSAGAEPPQDGASHLELVK